MKKVLALALAVLMMVALFAGCSDDTSSKKEDTYTVGFVYVGPIGDGGWTFSHDQGRLALEAELGVKTLYKQNVPENDTEVEKAIEELVDGGCNFVFTTSFGFMNATKTMAEKYPDVKFMHASGFESNDTNFGNYFGRIYQARYLSGIAAGLKTETNKIGYVAAMPIPEVFRGINAFTLGVQSVNPDAVVYVEWTRDWVDVELEKAAANVLLEQDCDVIAQHQDSPAPQVAAEQKGVFGIGYHTDMEPAAPNAVLTSAIWDWKPFYVAQIKAAMDGTWAPTSYWGSIAEDIVAVAPINEEIAAEGTVEAVEEAKAKLLVGDWDVFTGPIADQKGKVVIKDGETATDEEMLSMNYFIKGIIGDIA